MFFYLLASIVVSYVGGLVIYRAFFHPLCKYPGPILAALTEGYEAYYNIVKEGSFLNEIERLHEVYGPVVRVGPNALHFNDRKAYHDIYTHGSKLIKEPVFYHHLTAHCRESSVGFIDPQEAKNRRGLIAPLFSRKAVASLEYTIQTKIDKLVALLEEKYNSPTSSVDLSDAYQSLTVDIITSYCFAECTNALDIPGFTHFLVQGQRNIIKGLWLQIHFPFLTNSVKRAPEKLILRLSPQFRGYVEMKTRFERQIDRLIRNPESLSIAEHETIYHHLLAPKSQDRPSRRSLVDEAFTLVGAGSDTTSRACTVGTFYFLKYESIRKRILQELYVVWPDKDRSISFVALEKLPYLTAFIKEALRFAPGIIHPLPRQTGDTTSTIGRWAVPPRTSVEMGVLFMHMNPDIYPDPRTFNPDRWLAEDTGKMMEDLVPFSKGPRICLGVNLAWCELYLIFANIFRKLDLKLLVTEDTIEDYGKDHIDSFQPLWKKGYRAFVDKPRRG
ncbi:hypothetical protein GYMLUDRAFT_247190 [Collybiopsis luxurians FD-317 M1]|uniref:Cytochrome P450 n=1 Tax=Collybiopsis luxurians FD-317 M1 TaxID=944289 RepID=A0A0D0CPH6_9AGAR|nr:hypothetical protein GYMLUDRAFT_247190 [Collybiopsis luxurians FD-317 M1]